ncbi:Ig-like domain-containing protein [Paenibacillus sp. JX-17]|uniref:Ig-like domain-containing protein n=1 Tax=Paenibacillus lacisoli TaxID=3064525 RepID=A0ABT9CC46_9BACL|nr:Ig-like domain-containing protein [Paenibacillus sp. JX-17]MDO7906826.1 Ig-like domain-containing protein [Paenibacillus sp. JX-17]
MLKKSIAAMTTLILIVSLLAVPAGVTRAAEAALSNLVLSKSELTLEAGESAALTATAVYSDGTSGNVTLSAEWSSKNDIVAAVNGGSVTAKSSGTATIEAAYKGITKTVQVTVTKKVKALLNSTQSVDLRLGGSEMIGLTAMYADNTTMDVAGTAVWTSDNTKVATVLNGKVTAVSAGSANIQAVYGKQTVIIPVTVEQLKRLEANKTATTLLLNEKDDQIVLTATYPNGDVKDVTAAAEWSSSNEKVADVLKGVITGYSSGSAVITAKYGARTAAINVDVDKTSRLKVNESSLFLHIDDSKQLNLSAVYPERPEADVTTGSTWTSSNEAVASVTAGKVRGNSAGTAVITGKYGDKTIQIPVSVEVAQYLDLGTEEVALKTDGTKELKLQATYIDGSKEDVTAKASWTSSNGNIAFVSDKGIITAHETGEATITASYGGKTATVKVAVNVPVKMSLSAKSISLDVDKQMQINLIAEYEDGREENVSSQAKWTSSSDKVVEVEDGLLTGIAMGNATVTTEFNGKKLTATVKVGIVDKLEASTKVLYLSVKDKAAITLTTPDGTAGGKDVTADAKWSSNTPDVAEVNKGVVTAYSSGKATITADYGSQKVTIRVEVDIVQKVTASVNSLSLKSGDKKTIAIKATYSDGTVKDVGDQAEWKSSSYKIATVEGGQVTAVSYGTARITAKFSGKTITIPVDIDQLKYLETSEVILNLKAGDQVKVTATATFKDESEKDVSKPALWASSKITVVTAKDGVVKATGKGKAVITVSYAGKKTKIQVVVN